jgi:hypothetical protein
MWPFGNRAKLIRLLGRLAFYNDKGISYARHDPAQVQAERTAAMAKIVALVGVIGPDSLPPAFLHAVATGDLATDLTGQYIGQVKAHFRGRAT